MNTEIIDTFNPLDHELRALDPAVTELDAAAQDRKAALLASIVGTPSAGAITLEARRRRPRARWLIPAAAAAAVAVGMFVLPVLPTPKAYASWTPTPSPVLEPDRTQATDACRARLAEAAKPMDGVPADQQPVVRPETAKVVVAERRGEYVFVALRTDTGSQMECLSAAGSPGTVTSAGAGLATAATATPKPLVKTQLESSGGLMVSGPEGALLSVVGRAGSDVRSIALRSEGRTVQATVTDGYFAAWWPTASLGTPPIVEPIVSYDVALTDGSVLTDVDPGGVGRQTLPGAQQIGGVVMEVGMGEDGTAEKGVAGRAGAQVASVRIDAGDRVVDAAVVNGVFKATWSVPKSSIPMTPSGTSGVSTGTISDDAYRYTLTLTDGTVLTDVTPIHR